MVAKSLNGSVDLLAKAMRAVFTEAVEGAIKPLRKDVGEIRKDMGAMETRLNTRIDAGLTTTNENMQAQLAQQRKDVSSDVRRILKRG